MLTRAQVTKLNVARAILVVARRKSPGGAFADSCLRAEKALLDVLFADRYLMGNAQITNDDLIEGD